MKRSFFIIFALLFPLLLLAQDQDTTASDIGDYRSEKLKKLKPKKKVKIAKKLEKKGSYLNAIVYLEEAYEAKPDNHKALAKLAELNYITRDYKKAEKWYNTLLQEHEGDYPESRYYYAQCLKRNKKYDKAIEAFEEFKGQYAGEQSELKDYSDVEIEGCKLAKQLMAAPVRVNIEHLDENINNKFTDFAPRPNGEDAMIFGSIISDTAIAYSDLDKDSNYRSKIYSSSYADGAWSKKDQLPAPLNEEGYHSGNAMYSSDGNTIYFTRCEENNDLGMDCKILMSKKEGETWSEPEELGESVNDRGSSNTHPAIAVNSDGKEVLYFSSNRESGKGGFDIYYSVKKDGKFGAAVNLGDVVNTMRDDITPYYDSENGMLYFSSEGQVGIGGYDVFMTEGSENAWGELENAGFPLNTSVDDIYFAIMGNEKDGFLVSNRPGGFNLKSETCCDDIYQFRIIKELFLKGYVAERKNPDVMIEGADVTFFSKTGSDLNKISNLTTGADEYFIVPLQPELIYQANTTKPGYWGSEEVLDVADIMAQTGVEDTIERIFFLDEILRLKVKLKKIYYTFDRYNLTREYKKSLDSLTIVLTEYPEFTLDIYGHTDSKGSDEYNMKLGQRRAQAAADYLMAKGITSDRLVLISKGEGTPAMPNAKDNGGDDPLGRANNRRVEFKINTNDKYLEVEIEYENNKRTDTR